MYVLVWYKLSSQLSQSWLEVVPCGGMACALFDPVELGLNFGQLRFALEGPAL
jgi:hypothetical protein